MQDDLCTFDHTFIFSPNFKIISRYAERRENTATFFKKIKAALLLRF